MKKITLPEKPLKCFNLLDCAAPFPWLMIHFETTPICHFSTLPKQQISLRQKYKKGLTEHKNQEDTIKGTDHQVF